MLTVTLHAGPLANASFNNRLGWMEVAYATKPKPLSDYKAVVSTVDAGASPPIMLKGYPRYAVSIWDLVARVLSTFLTPEGKAANEQLWPFEPSGKFIPYATAVCVIVEMQSTQRSNERRILAQCEIRRLPGARGRYEAIFSEDCLAEHIVESFIHRPAKLNHWQLVQTALAWRLSGQEELPPRPFLFQPDPVAGDRGIEVSLDALAEPARTCFERWLAHRGHTAELDRGLAGEKLYVDFLHALA